MPLPIIKLAFNCKKKLEFKKLQRSCSNLEHQQLMLLKKILKFNRQPIYDSYQDFSSISHIQPVEDFQKDITQLMATGKTQLFQGKPIFFAMTAGSTGKFKYIPITKKSTKAIEKSVIAFNYFLNEHCPETKHQPIQFLAGSAEGGFSPSGVPIGFMSGFNYKNLPKPLRKTFVVPYWVFTIENPDERYYAIARYLMSSQKLCAIGAFSPNNITNIAKACILFLPRLIKDLEEGTVTVESQTSLKLKSDKVLSEAIKKFLEKDLTVPEQQELCAILFPSFKYAVFWRGGNMPLAVDEFEQYFSDKTIFEMPFSATEGVFSIPFQKESSDGILAINSHFFEFIAEDDPSVIKPSWEVEKGRRYYLVITTFNGLYRYNMEDLVEVTGFWHQAPVIRFVCKKTRLVSLSNERLQEDDVVAAMQETKRQLPKLDIEDFLLVATEHLHYCLFVSVETENIALVQSTFEKALSLQSKGYAFEREDKLLKPVEVIPVDKNKLLAYKKDIVTHSSLPTTQQKPIYLAGDVRHFKHLSALSKGMAR